MDKPMEDGRIYKICGTGAAVLLALLTAGVLLWVPGWPLRTLMLGGLALLALLGLLLFGSMRRSLVRYTDILADTVDDLIEGHPLREDFTTTDTLSGRVQLKLRRLSEITLRQTRDNLREKETIQGLVSDISHQVKTPAATIKMYCDILRDREVPPDKRAKFFAAVDAQVNKLDFLMQAMIKMSRLETGVLQLRPREAALRETAEAAKLTVQAAAAAKGVSVSCEVDEGIRVIHDLKWTAEAVGNLLDNAVKYTASGGSVTITAEHREFFTRLTVRDTGRGIPEQEQGKIFGRFYRESAVQDAEGVGIGLYLVREIMALQGGMIEVRSEPGAGAAFVLSFPN